MSESEEAPRYHCVLRYVNTDLDGEFVQKWFSTTSPSPSTKALVAGEVKEVPDSYMPLYYNEVPTQVNWHYLRWRFDLSTRRNVELQINDRVMDLRDVPVPPAPTATGASAGCSISRWTSVLTRMSATSCTPTPF